MQHEAADGATLASYDVTTLASVSLIWCLVAFNFYVLAVRRHAQQPWNWLSLLVGYGGLALQALSFYRCRHTNPGTVTDEWVAAATAGTVPASICPRSGKLVPPGGLYVRRAGESVILGFDHYCFWLGAPVGLRNRRHFILFTVYTGALAAIAAGHLAYELLVALPARLDLQGAMRAVAATPEVLSPWRRRGLALLTSPSPRAGDLAGNLASNLAGNIAGNLAGNLASNLASNLAGNLAGNLEGNLAGDLEGDLAAMEGGSAGERWSARAIAPLVWALELGAAAFDQGQLPYLAMLLVALAIDLVSAGVVGHQAWWHLRLVLQGRRTLAPEDGAEDAGYRANWERVFGSTRLWLLPLKAGGPTTAEGLAWGGCNGTEGALREEKRKAT